MPDRIAPGTSTTHGETGHVDPVGIDVQADIPMTVYGLSPEVIDGCCAMDLSFRHPEVKLVDAGKGEVDPVTFLAFLIDQALDMR